MLKGPELSRVQQLPFFFVFTDLPSFLLFSRASGDRSL
jgi:hypothetical protein